MHADLSDQSGVPAAELGKYATRQAERLRRKVASAVASGDVDAVHDLRVASRRLQEALDVIAGVRPSARVRDLRRKARRVRRAFRKVRDLDVMLASLAQIELAAAPRARLEGLLAARRDRSLKRATRTAAKVPTPKMLRRVRSLASKIVDSDEVVRRTAEMFRARSAELVSRAPAGDSAADLHPARIALKRVRYAAELLNRTGGLSRPELLDELARMQDRFGHWNDCIAAARRLTRIAARRSDLVDTAWSASLLRVASSYLAGGELARREIVESWPALGEAIEAVAGTLAGGAAPLAKQPPRRRAQEQLTS
jgi:CHAD domain-containing protein